MSQFEDECEAGLDGIAKAVKEVIRLMTDGVDDSQQYMQFIMAGTSAVPHGKKLVDIVENDALIPVHVAARIGGDIVKTVPQLKLQPAIKESEGE